MEEPNTCCKYQEKLSFDSEPWESLAGGCCKYQEKLSFDSEPWESFAGG